MAAAEKIKRRTHKERRAESDKRMIEAAMALFAEKGYQKTTLIQIGDKAGCTGTLVSNRFGSKEGILRAVLAHILSRFVTDTEKYQVETEKLERILATAPEDISLKSNVARTAKGKSTSSTQQLKDFIRTYLEDVVTAESRIRALHVLMGEALAALPEIRDEIIKVNVLFRARVAAYIRAGVESGEFREDVDVEASSMLIVGLLRGVTTQALMEREAIDLMAEIERVQEMSISPLA